MMHNTITKKFKFINYILKKKIEYEKYSKIFFRKNYHHIFLKDLNKKYNFI